MVEINAAWVVYLWLDLRIVPVCIIELWFVVDCRRGGHSHPPWRFWLFCLPNFGFYRNVWICTTNLQASPKRFIPLIKVNRFRKRERCKRVSTFCMEAYFVCVKLRSILGVKCSPSPNTTALFSPPRKLTTIFNNPSKMIVGGIFETGNTKTISNMTIGIISSSRPPG